MRIFGFLTFTMIILLGCMQTPNYGCQESKPLTGREVSFFNKIEALGLKIKERPDIGYGYRYWFNDEYPCHYSPVYEFWIKDVPNSWFKDSTRIQDFVSDLYVDLYSNVLEDSVRCFINSYQITLISKDKDSRLNKNRSYITEISGENLADFIGYKIIRDKNGLKKVDTLKSDEMVLTKEEGNFNQ